MLNASALSIIGLHIGILLLWLVLRKTTPLLSARLPFLGIYHLALAGFSTFVRQSSILLSVILVVVGVTFVAVGISREKRLAAVAEE